MDDTDSAGVANMHSQPQQAAHDKTPDGGAAGRTEWHRAGFMAARTGRGHGPPLRETTWQAHIPANV